MPFAAERYGVIPDMITLRQGRHLRHRADGRRDRAQEHLRCLHARARARRSSCSTATPIRRTRSPARPGSRRSTSTATKSLFERAKKLEPMWPTPRCRSRACPACSTSARVGLAAASISPRRPDAFGKRGYEAMERAFHEHGLMFRITGDTHRALAAADHQRERRSARSSTRSAR